MRSYHFLQHLLRGHKVTMYAIASPLPNEADTSIPRWSSFRQNLFQIPRSGYVRNAVEGLFSRLPLQVKLYKSRNLMRALAQAKFGPQAIIEASRNMELYDEEVGFEPCRRGIH
ncbi:MAG: hypothetical protein P8Z30_17755, partial [Acidobacteriota bacterium]